MLEFGGWMPSVFPLQVAHSAWQVAVKDSLKDYFPLAKRE